MLFLLEDLVQHLYELAMQMPDNVRQVIFSSSEQINMLHKEKTLGTKQSRDPTDQLSYQAQCSRCACFFHPDIIGINEQGHATCRKCSQLNGNQILATLKLSIGQL